MDATITYHEVAAVIGTNIPLLEPHPSFEHIQNLRRHSKCALQCIPCPQSIQHGWRGVVMAHALYTLLTVNMFRLPTNSGDAAIYIRPILLGKTINTSLLTRTEQASIFTCFNCQKHYYLLMQNIEPVCLTSLNSSINNTFKISSITNSCDWHAGM
jgi:hypothetical protein